VSPRGQFASPLATAERAAGGPIDDLEGIADPATAALWPTASQELLLRAAVLGGPEALTAWSEWKSGHDLI
jgi:hypothetical protein